MDFRFNHPVKRLETSYCMYQNKYNTLPEKKRHIRMKQKYFLTRIFFLFYTMTSFLHKKSLSLSLTHTQREVYQNILDVEKEYVQPYT